MRISKSLRALSFVLVLAMLLCVLPPFALSVEAADEYSSGAVVINPQTHKDGDTITILQGVYSVTVDSVDVNLIFGQYVPTGVNLGVVIDRRKDGLGNAATGYVGSAEALYSAGASLGWTRANGGYYAPTAPVLITGNANVTALFYGKCEFYAGSNGCYVTQTTSWRPSYQQNYESSNWRRGGYAGIQVDANASLTITNADNLSAYGAYQNTGNPSTNNGVGNGGASDTGSAGGAGIGGGVSYNTISSAEHPSGGRAAYPAGYTAGTPGNITIMAGNVYAQGGHLAAGIGGGHNSAATTGSIRLIGGNITAQGGQYAAGIGEGDSHFSYVSNIFTETSYSIVIGEEGSNRNLNVIAKGGYCAAGIGTTDELSQNQTKQSGLSIEIYRGNITATSGLGDRASAAIGAGDETDMMGNSITIRSEAFISAASFSDYAINNHGVDVTDLPVVNLDPEAYMYLARFDSYSADRTITLYKIYHNENGHAMLVNTTAANIRSGNWNSSNAIFYAYDNEQNKYYRVNQRGEALDEDGNVTDTITYVTPTQSLSFYFDNSAVQSYTVPGSYKAIAITVPNPSAYVLATPYNNGQNTTYSVIQKYNSGVTSGRVQWQSNYHVSSATLTPNMLEDAVAAPLSDIKVGLPDETPGAIEDNLIVSYNPTTYGYTVYVPSDTTHYHLGFKYDLESGTPDNTTSILVDVKRALLNSGDISIDSNTNEGLPGIEEYTLNPGQYYPYDLGFREDTDVSEIWIRKTDHAAVGTPTYVVYKVTVIRKIQRALTIEEPLTKVYDGAPVKATVTGMTDEAIGFVPTIIYQPATAVDIVNPSEAWLHSENSTISWITQTIPIAFHDEDGNEDTDEFDVLVTAKRLSGTHIMEIITHIECTEHYAEDERTGERYSLHQREVGTSINLITGRITHYGDTHSTLGHASIDVGAKGGTNGEAFVQIVCHGIEYPIWRIHTDIAAEVKINEDGRAAARHELRAQAQEYLQQHPMGMFTATGSYVKGTQPMNTNLVLMSPYLLYGPTEIVTDERYKDQYFYQRTMDFMADAITIQGNFLYSAHISNGGVSYLLTEDQLNTVTYTYYENLHQDDHLDDDDYAMILDGAPKDAGHYFVEAKYEGDTFEAVGQLAFSIDKATVEIKGIQNWLTYLNREQIEDLEGKDTLEISDTGEIYFDGIVGEEVVALHPDVRFYYNNLNICYNVDKITVSLAAGLDWLPDELEDNRNYQLIPVHYNDDTIMLYRIPGELAYEVDDAIFRKTSESDSAWRKYWPSWSEEYLKWDENGNPISPDIDYHSPSSNAHRNLVTLRTVNQGDAEKRYSVDLVIGALRYEFTKEIWDVNTHQYVAFPDSKWVGNNGVNNCIEIINHSNAYISYQIDARLDGFYGQGIQICLSENSLIDAIPSNQFSDRTFSVQGEIAWDWSKVHPQTQSQPNQATYYLYLIGTPQNPAPLGTGGTGQIVITILPSSYAGP